MIVQWLPIKDAAHGLLERQASRPLNCHESRHFRERRGIHKLPVPRSPRLYDAS